MALLVLVVLMWGVVRGEEYGSGGIPHYGGAAGDYADPAAGLAPVDYTGHSPDAAAPLDYKYVEDPRVSPDKFSKEDEVTDRWQHKPKKRRHRHQKDDLDGIDSQIHFIKHRSNHRPRHRSRLKTEKSRGNEPHRRRRVLTDRASEDNIDDDNHYRDEVKKETRDDLEHIAQKITTERIIRRKPRDRRVEIPVKRSDSEDDEFVESDHNAKDEKFLSPDYQDSGRRRGRPPPPSADDDDFVDEESNYTPKPSRRKPDKNYREYNDYYDMKRVYNIKNRLPLLIRRTSTGSASPTSAAPKDLLALLAGARRADSNPNPVEKTNPEEEELTTTSIITTTTAPTIFIPTTSISPVQFMSPSIITLLTPMSTTFETPIDLSLAEKSRLSILKKSQRKEKDKNVYSTKPPILLHVTSKFPTIVMVEPQATGNPWMRAREVTDDNPETLDKVKRLMRKKLVAQAKDIKDLTDNWNDMVCDYIDTSLLESHSHYNAKGKLFLIIFCSILDIAYLYIIYIIYT